ncbi:MAG: acyl--CoA ligase [Robiginitomaculum sp.]|nr:acyl--CoA ligase [Robiginitomaculum sp.]
MISKFIDAASKNQKIVVTDKHQLHRDVFFQEQCQDTSTKLNTNIAIAFKSCADLIQALNKVDSNVETLLLLSPTLSKPVAQSLMQQAGTKKLYADNDIFGAHDSLETLLSKPTGTMKSPTFDTIWLLATSGTTDRPKLVPHSLASLTRTVRIAKKASTFVWGQLYDNYRFAGMQVILQALAGQSILVSPALDLPLCKKLELFAQEKVNALSATPTLWRKILMTDGAKKLKLLSITLGGEIADASILKTLKVYYPEAKIRHIYASTEAGAGFSVSDGLPGFPTSFLDDGFNDIKIKIVDDILYIQNKLVSGSYIGDGSTFVDEDKYVNTGDRVQVKQDRVYFLGRLSGIINVGGDKVSPETIEIILNGVDGVSLSRVYGKKSPLTGELVVAEIIASENQNQMALQKELIQTCKNKLEPYQRPIAYRFVDKIKISENGKVVR